MGTKLNPGRFDCYAAALLDEPMFILLGRDSDAPAIVSLWAARRQEGIEEGERPAEDCDLVAEARHCANAMKQWRKDQLRGKDAPRWQTEAPPPMSDEGFRHAAREFLQSLAAREQRADAEATALRMSLAEADARIEMLETQDTLSRRTIYAYEQTERRLREENHALVTRVDELRAEVAARKVSAETISVHDPEVTEKRTDLILRIIQANAPSIRQILFGEPPEKFETADGVLAFRLSQFDRAYVSSPREERRTFFSRTFGEPYGGTPRPQAHEWGDCPNALDPDRTDDLSAPHETPLQVLGDNGTITEAYYDCSCWNYGRPDEHRAGAEVELDFKPKAWREGSGRIWKDANTVRAESPFIPPHDRGADILTDHPRSVDFGSACDLGRQLEP